MKNKKASTKTDTSSACDNCEYAGKRSYENKAKLFCCRNYVYVIYADITYCVEAKKKEVRK